jgi:RNA-binding protein
MRNRLEGHQRAALLKQAHELKPVATVGKAGLTQEVRDHVDDELSNHEMIKIRFGDFKAAKRDIAGRLSTELSASLVAVIGNVGILYRPADSQRERRISLPASRRDGR